LGLIQALRAIRSVLYFVPWSMHGALAADMAVGALDQIVEIACSGRAAAAGRPAHLGTGSIPSRTRPYRSRTTVPGASRPLLLPSDLSNGSKSPDRCVDTFS
jgi:hypothetical protein